MMAKQTQSKTHRRPSIGGTVAKIAFGLLFIIVSFDDESGSDPVTFLAFGLVIGLAMIAWALLPWLACRREEKRLAAQEEERRKELARRRAEEKAERENAVKICSNCGATSRGKVCEYCGSKLH